MSVLEKKRNKTIENKIALFGLFITIIIGLLFYYEQSMIGFPDGHLTEYDRFYIKVLYPIFFYSNILFLVVFILSLFVEKKSRQILFLYIGIIIIYLIVNYYFSLNLENGQGG